ncbi:MAG: hypothetical protein A2046_04480 [Bacteroidetes bacterium GWA2_30_7]|nr:MAG: hypothetical protein A2046_04480 [Bacteroidetes bacterium GWA2_30_7]
MKNNYFYILVIIAFTFITFLSSLKNDFVNWDDDFYVLQNPDIRELTITSVSNIFSSEYFGFYLPLTIVSYSINYSIGGLNPFGYHLLNIILHVISTIVLFFLVKNLKFTINLAFFVALIFAIHPLRVESVVWISERKDVLYVCFYLISLLFFSIYILKETKKNKWYLLSLLFFILSLLSKTSAVTLPLILLLIVYLTNKEPFSKLLIKLIPFFLLSLIFGILTVYELDSGKNIYEYEENYTFIDKFFLATYSFIFYILKLIFPFDLSPTHYFPNKTDGLLPLQYYFSGLLTVFFAYLLYLYRKNRVVVFGAFIYIFAILLFLQILPAGRTIASERYSYIAHIGLLIIIGYFLNMYFAKREKLLILTTILIGLFMSFLTYRYSLIWKNGETLFTHSILKNENKSLGYINRGLAHYYGFTENNKIDYNKAFQDFDKAISIDKKNSEGWFNRGNCYFNMQKINEAERDFDKTLSIDSLNFKAWNNRGLIYAYKGNFDMAMKYYNHSIFIKNTFPDAYSNIAFVYLNNGDNKLACEYFEKALKLGSATAGNYLNQYCK